MTATPRLGGDETEQRRGILLRRLSLLFYTRSRPGSSRFSINYFSTRPSRCGGNHGGLSLLEYVSGFDLRIDRSVVAGWYQCSGARDAMAPITALNFLGLGSR